MAQIHVNRPDGATTLNATLANGATTATLASGTAFPAIASPDWMYATLDDGTNTEIVKITAHTASSTTITIARGQDGSTQYAGTWGVGTKFESRVTKGSYWPNTMERETFSNAAYTIGAGGGADRHVVQTGTLSAARVVTLPAASTRVGQRIIVSDESGSPTWANYLDVTRAGSDTINGQNGTTNTSVRIWMPRGGIEFVSDGSSKWHIVRRFPSLWYGRHTSSTTTFYRDPDMKWALVGCQGGGGGGAGRGGTTGGGGGAAGQWVAAYVDLTGSSSYTLTAGSAGSAGANYGDGGAGGSSSFGSLLTAVGGPGGSRYSAGGATPSNAYLGAPYPMCPGIIAIETNSGNMLNTPLNPWGGSGGDGNTAANVGGKFSGSSYSGGAAGGTGSYGGGGGGASLWAAGGKGGDDTGGSGAGAGSLGSGGGGGDNSIRYTGAAGGAGFVDFFVFF